MNDARDGVTELDLTVADGMAAENDDTRGATTLLTAANDVEQPRHLWIFVVGIADEIESRLRRAAHRIDVAQRVGGGDLAVYEGIVDDRRKKVDSLDDGQVLGQLVDTGVVVGVRADEEMGIVIARKMAQNLRYALRGQLARSAGARSVVEQTFFAAEEQHGATSFRRRRLVTKSGETVRRLDSRHASRWFFQQSTERVEYPLFVGELFRFQLRVQQFPVGGQLEAAPIRGDQFQIVNLLLERSQQFVRQTDGARFVASHRTITQF